jgi:hypothetical protein
MDYLRIRHRVSVNESLLIPCVPDGIKIVFQTDCQFLVRHVNLRPYQRLNMQRIHGE